MKSDKTHTGGPSASPTGQRGQTRRQFINKAAAVATVAAAGPWVLGRTARAAGRTIKLGFVSPRTGVLAAFAEADDFVLGGVRKAIGEGLVINGVTHKVEILTKDSRSDPNRAAEVASDLIKSDRVDLLLASNTPETVNPVADQAELNERPLHHQRCAVATLFLRARRPSRPAVRLDLSFLLGGRGHHHGLHQSVDDDADQQGRWRAVGQR